MKYHNVMEQIKHNLTTAKETTKVIESSSNKGKPKNEYSEENI